MTVTATESTVDYEGDGVTTSWPVNFPAEAKSDFLLWLIDEDDVMTVVDAADFDIVFNADQTSTITYPNSGSPLASGLTLYIERAVPYTQPTYIANQRKFYATSLQEGLDRAVMQIQQVKTEVNKLKRRALRLGDGDFGNLNAITNKSARANFAVGFDSNGQVSLIPNGSISDEWTSAVVNFKVYNPNDSRWGATGDGVTDDTTEVQDCFDDLVLAGGGILEFTHLHRVTAPIVVSTDVPIFISSPNVYIGGLICDHGGDAIRLNLGTVGVAAAPRIISVGIWKASGAASGGTAIKINYSDLNSGSYKGIELLGNFISRIGSSYFTNAVDLTRCTHATLERNFIQGQGGTASTKVGSGVNLNTWCQGLTVHNNKIRGFLHGLLIDDISVEVAEDFQSEGYSIRGNTVSNCTNGLTSTLTATEVSWVIEANSFDCTLRGLSLDNIIRTQIVNNRFGWNGGHTDHADIFLQRTDGSSSVASTLQSIVNSNRAFRKGDLELRITGVTRGATTTLSYSTASKTRNITAISKTNPCVVTYAGGDAFSDDDNVVLAAILGMTELNGYTGRISNVNTTVNTFELPGVDATGFTAYISGGTATLSNGTGTIANDNVLYVYGLGGTVELNRKPIKVASLDTGAGTFVAKDYETGADIVSTNYGAFSDSGTAVRYGRFLEVKGGAGVDATGNQITFRNCGYHLWAQTKDVYWGFNRVIGEDGSSSIRGINNSSNIGSLLLLPFGAADYIVRDGGAPGDGVADDTAFLQAVLTAGKIVYLDPAKTYRITETVSITASYTGVEGNGALVIMSTAAGHFDNTDWDDKYLANAVGFRCDGASDVDRRSNCFVRNVRIRPSAWVDLNYLKPISHKYTTGFEVSGCEIWGFSRVRGHITGNNANGSRIVGNHIHDSYTNSTSGTDTEAQITGIEFDGDAARLVDANGEAYASRDLLIQGNRIINMTMSSAALVARGHQTDGINLQGITTTDTTSKPTRNFKVIGNTIRNCGEGIDCFGSSGVIANNVIEWVVFGVKNVYGSSHVAITGNVIRYCAEAAWYAGGSPSGVYSDLTGHSFIGNNVSCIKPKADWYSADGSKMYDYVASGSVPYRNSGASAGVKFVISGGTVINTVKYALIDGNTFDMASPDLGYGSNTDAVVVLHENGTGGSATNRVGNNRVVSYSPGVYNDPGKFLIIERGYPVTKTTHFALGDDEHEIIVNNAAGNTNITFPLASRHPGRRVRIKTVQNQVVQATSAVIVPLAGGAAGTAILAATAGKWAEIVSNNSNWDIMAGN